jgi:hypothetical protein
MTTFPGCSTRGMRLALDGATLAEVLRRERFAGWLDGLPGEAVVGVGAIPALTPLAQYLFERVGLVLCVQADAVFLGERALASLPDWARRFQGEVGHRPLAELTAAQCRALLARCDG